MVFLAFESSDMTQKRGGMEFFLIIGLQKDKAQTPPSAPHLSRYLFYYTTFKLMASASPRHLFQYSTFNLIASASPRHFASTLILILIIYINGLGFASAVSSYYNIQHLI